MPDMVSSFLGACGWSDAARAPVTGDASARVFTRLSRGDGHSAILMDGSAEATGSSLRFAEISRWLRTNGFSAPHIIAEDHRAGLLLVEDFGDAQVARLLARDPSPEGQIYGVAVQLLCALQTKVPMPGLAALDGPALAALAQLFDDWFVPAMTGREQAAASGIPALVERLYGDLGADATPVTSLRDFHAENVIWLPERDGIRRLGLLDFQDAVLAHPAYDVVSFLQDARRDLGSGIEAQMVLRFCALSGRHPDDFAPVYALVGAQRALRILGVFARLILQSRKPRYARFIPRVWGHLQHNLRHPALADLAGAVRAAVPEPTSERLESMMARCATA